MKQVVLITGVAGGIGHATAQLFMAEGWYIIGVDRKPGRGLLGIDHYISSDASKP
ncbi:MAG: SDR family NAD(P)-dependent oxidoreductase, partial [Microcystaceae cyanobacterium]